MVNDTFLFQEFLVVDRIFNLAFMESGKDQTIFDETEERREQTQHGYKIYNEEYKAYT